MITFILIGIAALLFLLAFITKRRFGVLGLGLSAGALLASSWSGSLAIFLDQNGFRLTGFSNMALAACLLTFAPALLLLIGGPTYNKKILAVIGAAGFALLGLLLVLGPISVLIEAPENVRQLLQLATRYQSSLIALGVSMAVVDMFLARGSAKSAHKVK